MRCTNPLTTVSAICRSSVWFANHRKRSHVTLANFQWFVAVPRSENANFTNPGFINFKCFLVHKFFLPAGDQYFWEASLTPQIQNLKLDKSITLINWSCNWILGTVNPAVEVASVIPYTFRYQRTVKFCYKSVGVSGCSKMEEVSCRCRQAT